MLGEMLGEMLDRLTGALVTLTMERVSSVNFLQELAKFNSALRQYFLIKLGIINHRNTSLHRKVF